MNLMMDYFGNTTQVEIEKLEKQFNIDIPEDYKQFLLEKNGGKNTNYRNYNEITINQINESINIDILFGVNTGVKHADIAQWTSECQEDLLPQSIIMGDTIQHGFIVYLLSNDEKRGLYYYDDTYVFESSSDTGNTYYLSSNFTEFLGFINQ